MKIQLKNKQKIFFCSDSHYAHKNICSGTSTWTSGTRQFDKLEDMNDIMVNNINSLLGEDDILFHLGDWSFGGVEMISEFRNKLKCKNIHLILGNHDQNIRKSDELKSLFFSVNEMLFLTIVEEQIKNTASVKHNFVLCHFPIASWEEMKRGAIHLHGHVHLSKDLRIGNGKMMDVGMDGNNLYPIELNEILELMKNQPIKSMFSFKDHHED
jgi:calcineurin-like phosphoesterase family protein